MAYRTPRRPRDRHAGYRGIGGPQKSSHAWLQETGPTSATRPPRDRETRPHKAPREDLRAATSKRRKGGVIEECPVESPERDAPWKT